MYNMYARTHRMREHRCKDSPYIMIFITDTECPEGYVKCQTSFQCIHRDWVCNDYPNCPDGSDESEETCKGRLFTSEGILEGCYSKK